MDKPSVLHELQWFDARLYPDPDVQDIVRGYRHLAETLVDAADQTSPELFRSLTALLHSMDDAVRVVRSSVARRERQRVGVLLEGKDDLKVRFPAQHHTQQAKS